MSFLAGVLALDRGHLRDTEKKAFYRALEGLEKTFFALPDCLPLDNALLARAGDRRLWQGPKHLSTQELTAVAAGTQWHPVPGEDGALGHLAREFSKPRPNPGTFLDCFCCAVLNKEDRSLILATDPSGLAPIFYTVHDKTLVFSSHQVLIRRYLGEAARPDLQSALEFLIIGHALGDRSLLSGVGALPPGTFLRCDSHGIRLEPYINPQNQVAAPPRDLSPSRAADLISDYLTFKRDSYRRISSDPVAGFLSGGWDSRYLIGLFSNADRIARTFTTQQRLHLGELFISEKKIAESVAAHLGVKNDFIPPRYRGAENIHQRALHLDFSTWFHDWAFHMAESLPQGRYLLLDGLLGDILLRGLFLEADLCECMEKGDRGAAQKILHHLMVTGFNTYTKGTATWEKVFKNKVVERFSESLWEDIGFQLKDIEGHEFVTLFLIKNRSRRGIAPLARLLFGQRGAVHLPFCDPGFIRLALGTPLRIRRDLSLYRALLEKARPGLSAIPSTNETDPVRLAPFLERALPAEALRGQSSRRAGKLRAIAENPPRVFMPLLGEEIQRAFLHKDEHTLNKWLLFLEKIHILEGFYGYQSM